MTWYGGIPPHVWREWLEARPLRWLTGQVRQLRDDLVWQPLILKRPPCPVCQPWLSTQTRMMNETILAFQDNISRVLYGPR